MYQPISHRQKKYNEQIYKYLIILVLLLVFLGTIGIKLLINLSLFIAAKTGTPLQTQVTSYLIPPTLNDMPDATNSAQIKISGNANNGNKLTLFLNGHEAKNIPISDNQFSSDITLTKGNNEIYVVLEDVKQKIKKLSSKITILYKNDKPKLDISSPHDGDKVNKSDITIQGQTDKDVNITINDAPVVIDANQKFSFDTQLNDGDNKITIVATDVAGNQETKSLTINYQKDN